jgi:hypothetical protein
VRSHYRPHRCCESSSGLEEGLNGLRAASGAWAGLTTALFSGGEGYSQLYTGSAVNVAPPMTQGGQLEPSGSKEVLALLRPAQGPSAATVWVALLREGRYLSGTLRVPLKQPIKPLFLHHSHKDQMATDNGKSGKGVYFVWGSHCI